MYPKRWLSCWKAGHRKNTREFIDEELADALYKRVLDSNWTDQEAMDALDYLHKFNSEFHKSVIKKGDTTAIHNTDKLRKDCYSRENAKNRDIMSRENKYLESLDDQTTPEDLDNPTLADSLSPPPLESSYHEDNLIDLIDATYFLKKKKDPN